MKIVKGYKNFNENVQEENENIQEYENLKSDVETWLSDNEFDYEVELDIDEPSLRVDIKKNSPGFSSEDLDAHYSSAAFRSKGEGHSKGGLLGDYTLLEEAYDQLAVVQSISNSIQEFGLSENRIYFVGEYIIYEFSI